ncbi:MAG: class I SAM-dependent methyltransferase [Actinomycetia bacterium]|nr:class I SAM-dependent methyltransferase [Actinomycetes bacterium]
MVHEAATTGYAREADRYHRGRPTYHPEIAIRVAQRYGQRGLVELGAGTGIFTRQLVDLGIPVIALEPVISMRTTLSEAVPEADVRVGAAERIPLSDTSAATIVASQSFHWFDYPTAINEIARVLEVGGHLVTVWNVRDDSTGWAAAYTNIIDRHANGAPRYRDMSWRRAINADPRLAPVDEWRVVNPQLVNAQLVVDRALSTSFIAALAPDRQDEVVAEIEALVEPMGPSFEFPYVSQLQAWRLIDKG